MQTPHIIPISKGEMSLILGGYKSLHFMRLPHNTPLLTGDIIHFRHNQPDGTHFDIPVTIISATPEHSNSPLNHVDEWKAGRISGKAKQRFSPDVSKQRQTKIEPTLATRIAKQFLERFETPLPKETYASDIAGNESAHPITRFSFARKLSPDEAYPLSDLYRRFKAAYDILAPSVTYAHQYQFTNHGHDGEFISSPAASELWAMRFLATHHTPVHLEKILQRMRAPYESLSQLSRAINESRPVYIPAPDPDGINKILASLPNIPCSRDTGSLAVMGAMSRIAVRTPLPEPASGNSTTFVLNANGRGNSISAQRGDFQVPIEVTIAPESTRIIASSAIDKHIAREHGFATPKDMRIAIGLGLDESCDILSYPFIRARPESLPLDPDRAGKHHVQIDQAARAIFTSHSSDSKRAKRYMDTLPTTERDLLLAEITPPDQYTEGMNAVAAPTPRNRAGTRQLPNDVLKKRKSHAPKTEKPVILQGFQGLSAALEARNEGLTPAPAPLPKSTKASETSNTSSEIETTLSPVITTPEELATDSLTPSNKHKEKLDTSGVPIPTAPVIPKRKTFEGERRESYIERARAAKKPKDPHALSRRERLRHERRAEGQFMRSATLNPEIISDNWVDSINDTKSKGPVR